MPSNTVYRNHIQKFKVASKTREQDAARVRENQRRHRARVKSHIEELESTLNTTQTNLEQALRRIQHLESELQQLKGAQEVSNSTKKPAVSEMDPLPMDPTIVSKGNNPLSSPERNHSPFSLEEVTDPENDCAFLPPPSPGESTMLCREAYRILAEHLSEVDYETARESLKHGFRRATMPGAGCRVQTHVLFSFVDRLT
ncbi:hypothetical protein QBC47DRAFT_191825 [Echria macrotheca]|uniref:BZIP domain-containing protein n=1 Tax=Echria macrotheca TaxID=438768 RepID=A0AAJ0FBQ0_9PEZI|nr:hypothetical protein QBC47DRAFT_191825 [Echria macrotheca]